MFAPRVARFLPFLTLLSVLACDCGKTPLVPSQICEGAVGLEPGKTTACTSDTQCGDHYACKATKDKADVQCCVFDDRRCNTEADCCPGQTCHPDRKKCFDKVLSCETDADCGDTGDRFCEVWTDSYGTSSRCRFKTCDAVGNCPEGQSCFKGECMAALPCGGACEAGKACVPTIDRCQAFACPVSCSDGFIATFNDNRNIWDSCVLPNVACECAELPPLRSSDLGRFSAIAADTASTQVLVSLYDGEYGDLVVNTYDPDGRLARQDYVDGIPESAKAKYGPSGARRGVVEPGPDVGRYSDIATTADGRAYVSYYDATQGDLKLAMRRPDGAWRTVRVDGADADVGQYSSIALDAEGLPVISYFQSGASESFPLSRCPGTPPNGDKRFITALKVARAISAEPGETDFTLKTLACENRPPLACDGCTDTCADPGSGPACYKADATCTGCEANTETCVMVGTKATCAKKYNPSNLNQIIDGVGLFTSVAVRGNETLVTYMRREHGEGRLEGIRISGAGTVSSRVVLDSAGDTGYFPDLKVDPTTNELVVAYHDFSSRALKLLKNPVFASNLTPEIIDSGAGAAGSGEANWVGSHVSLAHSPAGVLFVAYQDATRGDLKLASRTAAWEPLQSVRTDGAVGFFADTVFLGETLYMSHARIRATTVGGEPRVDNTLLIDQFKAP